MFQITKEIVSNFLNWYNNDPHSERENKYAEKITKHNLSSLNDMDFIDFFYQFAHVGGGIQSGGYRTSNRLKAEIQKSVQNFRNYILQVFEEQFDISKWLDNRIPFWGKGIATIFLNRVDKQKYTIVNNKSITAYKFLGYNIDDTSKSLSKCYADLLKAQRDIISKFPEIKNFYVADALSEYLVSKTGKEIGLDGVEGLIACDNTGWIEEAIELLNSKDKIIIWWDKTPTGTSETLEKLRKKLEIDESFDFYYSANGTAFYKATIIDFSKKSDYNEKSKNWNIDDNTGWFQNDFKDYTTGDKSAVIAFLATDIVKLDPPIATSRFVYYKQYQSPTQNNVQPYLYIKPEGVENINIIVENEILKILRFKKQIILQGAPGTGKTRLAQEIAYSMIFEGKTLPESGEEREKELKKLEQSEQYKIVQFHPAYSYEDFVRGITATPNATGTLTYSAENKLLGKFALSAKTNLENSKRAPNTVSRTWIKAQFDNFVKYVQKTIDENEEGIFQLNQTAFIESIEEDAFRYKGKTWKAKNGIRMPFSEIIKYHLLGITTRPQYDDCKELSGLAKWHAVYFYSALAKFQEFLTGQTFEDKNTFSPCFKYILVIDEINRANLPAVLGELIYALEYRDEQVDSMYATAEDGNKIVLPSNLYIIGTMNTADRSVGHIDYAIRRRFAFVDILPSIKPVPDFAQALFKEVSKLFIKNVDAVINNESTSLERSVYLAPDFRPEDVWIGHSYFIAKDDEQLKLKLEYEIKPILKEYVKDGVLLEGASAEINKL